MRRKYKKIIRAFIGGTLASLALWKFQKSCTKTFESDEEIINKDAEAQANEYQPVQSPSEIAAGHPIVGAS